MSISVLLWTIFLSRLFVSFAGKKLFRGQKITPGAAVHTSPGLPGSANFAARAVNAPFLIIYIHLPVYSNFTRAGSVPAPADRPPGAAPDAGLLQVPWAPDDLAERELYPPLPQYFPAPSSCTLRVPALAVVVHPALLRVRTISAAIIALARPRALASGVLALVLRLDVLHLSPPR